MDEQNFKQLYERNSRRIYNFILWTTGNRAVCDDIVQSVFMKVWRSRTVPPVPEEQTAWLYTVARNACIDYFRSRRRFEEYDDGLAPAAEQPEEPEAERGATAWQELNRLPGLERAIVYLHIKIGYSYGKIGHLLDIPEVRARVTAFRALRKLRAIMKRKGL